MRDWLMDNNIGRGGKEFDSKALFDALGPMLGRSEEAMVKKLRSAAKEPAFAFAAHLTPDLFVMRRTLDADKQRMLATTGTKWHMSRSFSTTMAAILTPSTLISAATPGRARTGVSPAVEPRATPAASDKSDAGDDDEYEPTEDSGDEVVSLCIADDLLEGPPGIQEVMRAGGTAPLGIKVLGDALVYVFEYAQFVKVVFQDTPNVRVGVRADSSEETLRVTIVRKRPTADELSRSLSLRVPAPEILRAMLEERDDLGPLEMEYRLALRHAINRDIDPIPTGSQAPGYSVATFHLKAQMIDPLQSVGWDPDERGPLLDERVAARPFRERDASYATSTSTSTSCTTPPATPR